MKSYKEFISEGRFSAEEDRLTNALSKFKNVVISRIGKSGDELYFDVQATFQNKKDAQSGLIEMEKTIHKEFSGAKKVNNKDWDNKPTWLQAEWKTNKQDEDDKPWEAFISMEAEVEDADIVESSNAPVLSDTEMKRLLDGFKYSPDNTSVWRRSGYDNLAVALNKYLYLYYLPNLDKVKLYYSPEAYDVSYKDEYFLFYDVIKSGDKIGVYTNKKSQFYKDAVAFFNELHSENISGKSFKDGKETNSLEIAKKYKDLNW